MQNKYVLFFCFIFLFQIPIFSQISAEAMVLKMNRGINLGNVLSAPIEGNWQDAVESSYFEDVASVGFKTVRIPADFFGVRTTGDTSGYSKAANTENLYTGTSADYVVSTSYLDRIDEVVTWSLENELVTIIDFHGSDLKSEFLQTYSPKDKYAAFYTHPTSAKRAADYEKFKTIWTQIANRFKDYSYDLVFEIINESYFYLSKAEMDELNAEVIAIIRNSGGNNAHRNIVITGGGENSYEAPMQISDEILESDAYLIPTFHYYLPRAFTASSGEDHNDFDWGTSEDKAVIDQDFGVVKTWADEKSVPILLGEFGADNEGGYKYSTQTYGAYGGPENASRVAFHSYLAQKAIDLEFSLTVWDSGEKSNKSIYLANQEIKWVTDVRNAVLGIDCLDTPLVENADNECGVETAWSLLVDTNSAVATISDSSLENAFTGTKAVEIVVATAGPTINKVLLKNQIVQDSELSDKTITLQTVAKANNLSGIQKFKFRLKITHTNDEVSYASSSEIELSSNYELYTFETVLPENIISVEFQVLCGAAVGTYYFDDFMCLVQDSPVLSIGDRNPKEKPLTLFPNPVSKVLNFSEEVKSVEIFNSYGQKVMTKNQIKFINVSKLKAGTYFIILLNKEGVRVQNMFVKN